MSELAIFWQVLLGICAAVISFGGAGAVIAKVLKAPLRVNDQVKQHTSDINDIKEVNNIQLRCILQMMNHMIDGNHTEQLKGERDELQRFLIAR